MTSSPHAMIPRPDELDLEFYRAVVKAGALRIQRCEVCGTWTHPAQAFLPYVTVVAELEEGPRLVATARGIRPDEIAIGMPIRIVTENKSEDFAIFWAERAEGSTR
jgi:uncharacterized OB-fold protein